MNAVKRNFPKLVGWCSGNMPGSYPGVRRFESFSRNK